MLTRARCSPRVVCRTLPSRALAAPLTRSYVIPTLRSPSTSSGASRPGNNVHVRYCSGSSETYVVEMPALSPTMTQGNLASWNVKVGDFVEPGTVLADIETDKATMELECQEEGFIAELLIEGGSKDVPVGKPILILVEDEKDIGKVSVPTSTPAASTDTSAPPPPPPPSSSPSPAAPSSLPPHLVLEMPSLSPTMETGNIASWQVNVGDHVEPGSVLAEIETDKATMEFECQEEGYVAKILLPSGSSSVTVGQPILVLAEEKDDISKFDSFQAEAEAAAPSTPAPSTPTPTAPTPAPTPTPTPATPVSAAPVASAPSRSAGERVFASPLARVTAQDKGIAIEQVPPTGPYNSVIQSDVLKFAASGGAAAAAPVAAPVAAGQTPHHIMPLSVAGETYTEVPHSNVRRIIAQKLTEAKQSIPHFYLTQQCSMDKLLEMRSHLNSKGEVKLSINDLLIKACASALKEVPGVNSAFHPDAIRVYENVDVSVAMQTDHGLLVPVLRGVHAMGLGQISAGMKELGSKGRAGKLTPEQMSGGTFTISNLGMFGISHFSAIINPPQACILAVGGTQEVVVPDANGGIKVQKQMSVTLSCDHRAVDGVLGSQWLASFKKFIEDPSLMLL